MQHIDSHKQWLGMRVVGGDAVSQYMVARSGAGGVPFEQGIGAPERSFWVCPLVAAICCILTRRPAPSRPPVCGVSVGNSETEEGASRLLTAWASLLGQRQVARCQADSVYHGRLRLEAASRVSAIVGAAAAVIEGSGCGRRGLCDRQRSVLREAGGGSTVLDGGGFTGVHQGFCDHLGNYICRLWRGECERRLRTLRTRGDGFGGSVHDCTIH